MTRRRLARLFWIGAAAVLVAAALVALVAVAAGNLSDTDVRIILTLLALLGAGGTSLAGLALLERRRGRALGRVVAAAAPVGLLAILWGIWSYAWNGDSDTSSKLAWSAVVALLAGLLAATSALLVRREALHPVATAAAALAVAAAALTVAGIWSQPGGDGFVKLLAALWILAVLAWFLVPVLQRFTSAAEDEVGPRVLATLGDVELVASLTSVPEGVAVDATLRDGERLTLRRVSPPG